MRLLLTGATGYIGQRLLPALLEDGHEVTCCVRDKSRFDPAKYQSGSIKVIEVDFLDAQTLKTIPTDIDAAFYLLHSMAAAYDDFEKLEEITALNFKAAIQKSKAKQVIYLSGIVNDQDLSRHLQSRKKVEGILASESYSLTTLRAGIIVGSGSASFEIIRDLVEKLPVMIAPKWLNTKSQPIAIRNVIEFLKSVLMNEETFGKSFDIGGPEILSYKEMLLKFAKIRKLKRRIFTIPVMTPRLSSYWLYFVTATSYALAVNLVDSMKVNVICKENNLKDILGISLVNYEEAITRAFDMVEHHQVLSSWKDALNTTLPNQNLSQYLEVPNYGCFKDERTITVDQPEQVLRKIWSIGGSNGWYFANYLWVLRGFIDQLFGGVGLRRGRKNQTDIARGEVLDFWRVLIADKKEKRLLLFAEMILPGEAWLEFKIDKSNILYQTATFRPLGLLGRLYWYALLPFHGFVFNGMIRNLAKP
ncbi:SDR family oxidoreductase [candidate division KSB1 bacterium]